MIEWSKLSDSEKNELIATHVLNWRKRDGKWYKINSEQKEEAIVSLPRFTSDLSSIWIILDCFDTYQITKMFPSKYRTIIKATKYAEYSLDLNESVCKAALKACGLSIN